MTTLQSACRDYQFADDVLAVRVISQKQHLTPTQCLGYTGLLYDYVVEVVDVFKGDHQVQYF